ncbi:MAG: hypothetical protein WEF86_05830 [Gemmatimonadota bacterium]
MVPVMSLWLPILLSAVAVFLLSAVIHMVLKYHANEFGRVPGEEQVSAALRAAGVPPGEYVLPYAGSMQAMQSEEYVRRREAGPVAFLNVLRPGPPTMTAELAQWFVLTVIVSLFAAYVASRALAPDAAYGQVFRMASTVAFAGYVLGLWQESIWYKRAWSTTLKSTFDGLLYALVTGGMFGWLWPS